MTSSFSSFESITIVFIGGFMTPDGWTCHPVPFPSPISTNSNSHHTHISSRQIRNINILYVYPSPVGSLHDRVCEIFYELVGGRVFYGTEHSKFHGHDEYGREEKNPKHPNWNEMNPIYLVGHSYGEISASPR
jgi:hypothetical protein